MAQKYQVLARKYRPQRFSEVVGQEAILTTLKNALKRQAIAHGYLFCGSRGVGKTTLARLFAKALNCSSPGADLEPCCSCPSCLEIASGQSLDVIEIDGASNRGIDDIRQINETVAFAPSHGKYKIYIIDEVHMLTKEAFNALLKTLEEPPEQAKFFFATTEPHKVLPTIISRCQRFDLGRLLPEQISEKLAAIARDLERSVTPEALHLLSHFADGSLRDAESLFDQILCFASETVTATDVQNALGLAPKELFFGLDQAYSTNNQAYAFDVVAQLFEAGKDLSHFLDQLIEHYRHVAVCKTLGEAALKFPAELTARYGAAAKNYTHSQALAILDLLIQADAQFSKSTSQRTALELTLLQVIRIKNRVPVEVLVRRLSELEQRLLETPHGSQKRDAEIESKYTPDAGEEKKIISTEARFHTQERDTETASPKRNLNSSDNEVVTPRLSSGDGKWERSDSTEQSTPGEEKASEESLFGNPAASSSISDNEVVTPRLGSGKKESKESDLSERSSPSEGKANEENQFSATAASPNRSAASDAAAGSPKKQGSHYETLLRFTAVELEGTVKTN